MTVALLIVVVLQTLALIAVGVILIVSRRALTSTRRALARERRGDARPRRKPHPLSVAPAAVKAVVGTVHTADAIIRKGIGGQVRSSIDDLAGWARVERPNLSKITASGQVALVFSDIEGSTERNARLGDHGWVKVLERHNELVDRRVAEHKGYVVKNQGDGFMIAFSEPLAAIRCCLAVQHSLRQDEDRPDAIRIRMGAHVGTSVRRGDDLFGLDVAMAARIADLADGGQVLVSAALREAIRVLDGVDDVVFTTPIEVEIKGIRGPQTVYAVEVRK